jgi:hypothetical protein
MNEELQDWNYSLNKQLQYEQEKNKLSYACNKCGGKAYYLTKEDSKLGYDCLCIKLCECTLGNNLRETWNRQDEKRNKQKE